MGKKHPLDIFRASGAGFDSASRERRTVLGRVVTSAPRATTPQAPAPAAPSDSSLPPAVAAARARAQGATLGAGVITAPPPVPARERVADPWAAPRPLRPPVAAPARPAAPAPPAAAAPRAPAPAAAPRARREPTAESAPRGPLPAAVNRALLVCAFVMVGGLALWTLAASVGGPALKSASPTAATGQVFRIQAAAYPGTPAGQASAFSARDLLRKDFEDVDVVGRLTSEPGVYSSFELVVGKAGSEKDLADVLTRLRAVKNWPGGQKQPFKDAAIQGFAP